MTDRPRGSGGRPEEGTPEYDWLYGDRRGPARGRASQPSDDATRLIPQRGVPAARPDETRVLPQQQPHRSRGAAPPPVAPPPTRPRPVSPPAPEPGAPRRRRPMRWIAVALLVWMAFLIAVPLWSWTRVEKVEAFPEQGRPDEQPGTTYLLVGSDSRAGLSKEEREELTTGGDVGQRTDTIMLLHTGDGPNLLMSIPRDSQVEIPGHGTTKINAAFAYGGPKLLVRTLEDNTGIRIDHYVEIGLGGFVDVVDAVGGIEICPTQDMVDPLAGLDIEKGCQHADGKTALGYARSRHTSGLGDIDRAKHQREVVSAVGAEAVSPWSVLNPVRYYRLNAAMPDFFRVSEGTTPFSMARFAWAMTRVDGETGLTCGVPISDLAVTWDPTRSEEMFAHIRDDDTEGIPAGLCTPSGLPK